MRESHLRRAGLSRAGFSLVEMLVASAIFLIVALAAYTAFDSGNEAYRKGEARAELQQRTRLAYDLIMQELRLAGFDYNRDGVETAYTDHPDEQIEFVAEHAFGFRGNFDYNDANGGREPHLEVGPTDPSFGDICCPIVTTGNDEIVVYALRSENPEVNLDEIALRVDVSAPRDAGWDAAGAIVGEEVVTIDNVDLSDDNPPYTLYRFSLDDSGGVVEQAIAHDVRSISFEYLAAAGEDFHCKARQADGSCAAGDQVPFINAAGLDELDPGDGGGARTARADIRRVVVELVGMSADDDLRYLDGDDTLAPHRRKLALSGTVSPPNLGTRGRPDLDDEGVPAPENVTVCGGQCNTVRVEWDDVRGAASYQVSLSLSGATEPFFTGSTPGIIVDPDADPVRVYAVFQRLDAAEITDGNSLFAEVRSMTGGDELSDPSDPSLDLTLTDVVRIEAPRAPQATGYDPADPGWPDVETMGVQPVTSGTTPHVAAENAILVSWVAPEWTLDVTDQGDPVNTWTTAQGSGNAALACDSLEWDPDGDGIIDGYRTWQREMIGDIRYFVFRSTDPHFVPTGNDLVGSILGEVDVETGRVTFRDETVHVWAGSTFNATTASLDNCRTYYYRVRAVDDCYTGTDPASRTDPHLSPFAPALNPDPTVPDSDDISAVAPGDVGVAIPGFAVPRARPEKPVNVVFTNNDRDTTDGDGIDATIGFDAAKTDVHVDPVTGVVDHDDVTITEYHVYSSALDPSFPLSDAINGFNGVRLDASILVADPSAGRIAYDDEDGDGVIEAHEDESIPPASSTALPASGLRIEYDGLSERWYRVAAVQCEAENTVPSLDPEEYDYSELSAPVQWPCDFGGGPYSIIDVDSTDFPNSVTATAYVDDPDVPGKYARLVLADPATGDRVMSQAPGVPVDLSGVAFFDAAHIAELTDSFGAGDYRITVEMEDTAGCFGTSDAENFTQSLPTCCLQAAIPFASLDTSREGGATVQEICGTQTVRVETLTLEIDNSNKGQPERFVNIWWGSELIWTGSNRTVFIDRTSNPLLIGASASQTLWFEFHRPAAGDILTITYDYNIAGSPGTCTFVQDTL